MAEMYFFVEAEVIVQMRRVESIGCPQGFEEWTGNGWSGNVEGCYCGSQMDIWMYSAVMMGRCNIQQFHLGCTSVPAQSFIPYTFWRNTHLCVRRVTNFTFFTQKKDFIGGKGIICGAGTKYQLQSVQELGCPVTDLSSQSLFLDKELSWKIQNNYPLVEFKIAEHTFCQFMPAVSPGRQASYVLEKQVRRECSVEDYRVKTIDSLAQDQLFQQNPRIIDALAVLPEHPPISDQYLYRLGIVRYDPWSMSCRRSSNLNLLMAKSHLSLSFLDNIILINFYFAVVFCVGSLMIVACCIVGSVIEYRDKGRHGYLYLKNWQIAKLNRGNQFQKDVYVEIFKFIAMEIVCISLMVVCVICYQVYSEGFVWYEKAISCTEGGLIYVLNEFAKMMGQAMIRNLIGLWLIVGVIVADLLFLGWRFWKGDLEEEGKQQPISLSESQTNQSDKSEVYEGNFINITEEGLVDKELQQRKHSDQMDIYDLDDEEVIEESYYGSSSDSN